MVVERKLVIVISRIVGEICYNMTVPEYYEEALKKKVLLFLAQVRWWHILVKRLVVLQLIRELLRVPIVMKIYGGEDIPNISMKKSDFKINRETANYLNNLDKLYVFDGFVDGI